MYLKMLYADGDPFVLAFMCCEKTLLGVGGMVLATNCIADVIELMH